MRQRPKFHHVMCARFADIDLQGHVFFGNFFTYMDEAFMAYIRELGFSWNQLAEMGMETYYVNTGCNYKGRIFLHDEIHIYTRFIKIGNTSLTAEMDLVKASTDETMATGFITAVMVDTRSHKPIPVPRDFRDSVEQYQSSPKH